MQRPSPTTAPNPQARDSPNGGPAAAYSSAKAWEAQPLLLHDQPRPRGPPPKTQIAGAAATNAERRQLRPSHHAAAAAGTTTTATGCPALVCCCGLSLSKVCHNHGRCLLGRDSPCPHSLLQAEHERGTLVVDGSVLSRRSMKGHLAASGHRGSSGGGEQGILRTSPEAMDHVGGMCWIISHA